MSKTIDELKNVLNEISDDKHTILDIFYYPKTEFNVRRDFILVVYIWDCLGVNMNSKNFENLEDCINYFRDDASKTSLSNVAVRHSTNACNNLPASMDYPPY